MKSIKDYHKQNEKFKFPFLSLDYGIVFNLKTST